MLDVIFQLGSAVLVALVASLMVRFLLGMGRLKSLLDARTRRTVVRAFALLFIVVGVVVVLSGRNEVIRTSLVLGVVSFLPRLVVGLALFSVALVLSRLVGVMMQQALRHRSAVMAARLKAVATSGLLMVGVLLALKQMGIQTDVLMIILAALLGAAGLAAGLAVGLGTLPLARQIAAGRHVEDRFKVGQRVRLGEVEGRIRAMSLASVSIVGTDGDAWEVPHESFLGQPVEVFDD